MQNTEQNRWILLDMARAMGGYGYDEMWWADVFEPDELEYSAPDLYEKFVNSSDYDPAAHWSVVMNTVSVSSRSRTRACWRMLGICGMILSNWLLVGMCG